MRATKAVPVLVAAATLGFAAGLAGAQGQNFESKVKILDDENGPPFKRNYYPRFTGTVRSPKDGCEPRRKVALFKEAGITDPVQGSDKTNVHGRFKIPVEKPNENDFYAVVEAREIGSGTCKSDKSPVFHHDGPPGGPPR